MSEPAAGPDSPASPNFRAPAVPATPPPTLPDHELLSVIGRGAYGEVWRALNLTTKVARAVKIVRRSEFEDDRPCQREFEGLLKYEPISRSHPGLVQILHVGRNEAEGYFYYVMELADDVSGRSGGVMESWNDGKPGSQEPSARHSQTSSLDAFDSGPPHHSNTPQLHDSNRYAPRTLRSDLKSRGRLPVAECLAIGRSLAAALRHLHEHRLVHRDIKPSNLIFVNGQAKLADIGLVTAADTTLSCVGTEGYIPPEGPGRPQGDLYSLGKTLYEAATGLDRRQFPELPSDLGQWPDRRLLLELNEVIVKACAADPRQRYRETGELERDLERLQEGSSLHWRRTGEKVTRMARRAAPIALTAALVLAVAAMLWPRSKSIPEAPSAATAKTIFVLPFRNAPGDGTSEEIAGRVTDGLIDSLGIILGKERVGPRKSGWLSKSEEEARRLAFAQIDPRYAVSGQLAVTNGRVEVGLSAYSRPPGPSIWTEQVDGSTNDLVALEWAVVERVARRLPVAVPDTTRAKVLSVLSNNVAAMEWCSRGDALWTAYSEDRLKEVRLAFHKAKKLDPNCLWALHGLQSVNRCMFWHRAHRESWSEMLSLSDDILRIDDSDHPARHWLAAARNLHDWDWSEEAVAGFRAVLRELPDGELYYCEVALLERSLGRFDEARKFQALQDAQRSSHGPLLWITVTAKYVDARYVELYEGKHDTAHLYDEVIAGGRFCQQQDPEHNSCYWLEALGHLGKRDYPAALAALRKGRTLYESQEIIGLQGYVQARRGTGAQPRRRFGPSRISCSLIPTGSRASTPPWVTATRPSPGWRRPWRTARSGWSNPTSALAGCGWTRLGMAFDPIHGF